MNAREQLAKDLLTTALEGGSNYWYEIATEIPPRVNDTDCYVDRVWRFVENGGTVVINDLEEETPIGTLTMPKMMEAFILMWDKYPTHFKNATTECGWDAETADVWFQLAVIGELTFG